MKIIMSNSWWQQSETLLLMVVLDFRRKFILYYSSCVGDMTSWQESHPPFPDSTVSSEPVQDLYFIQEQGYNMAHAFIYQDNKSAILLGTNGKMSSSGRTKHIKSIIFHHRQGWTGVRLQSNTSPLVKCGSIETPNRKETHHTKQAVEWWWIAQSTFLTKLCLISKFPYRSVSATQTETTGVCWSTQRISYHM